MRNTKQEFPHPLLSQTCSDYTLGNFSLRINEQVTDSKEFRFWFSYTLDSKGLEDLVSNGKANVILRVISSAASYRDKADFDRTSRICTLSINKLRVAKQISAQAFIVAAESIENFSLPEHNPMYFTNASFKLRKGDILAESTIYIVKLDDSEMEKPLSSIFQIIQNDDAKESYAANYSDNKIRIFISPRLYEVYHSLRRKGEFRRFLSAVLVLPALIEALTIMQSVEEEGINYSNLRWYRAIENKLKKINVNVDDRDLPVVMIANQLLGDITWDALNSLKTTIDDINRSSETIESEWRD